MESLISSQILEKENMETFLIFLLIAFLTVLFMGLLFLCVLCFNGVLNAIFKNEESTVKAIFAALLALLLFSGGNGS